MTSIMMRILSLLPMITAGLCGILLLISMAEDNLSIPWGMVFLDLDANVQWDRGDVAWVGIVEAKWANEENCPPDDNGLTDCESTDFEYLSGGPDSDGSFVHTLSPGDTRFVTGGKEGSLDLSTQTVVVDITVSLSFWVEILLLLAIANPIGIPIEIQRNVATKIIAKVDMVSSHIPK